ncbi:MAG TPA: YraN family protein [Acidimicrobiales bacterium]|nr:YraN family protein [Acidimicrobiales bacterium]
MTRQRQVLGASGEEKVAAWYRERGYEVLSRNWRRREGELDLVLGTEGLVVFCEVKTRSSDAFGAPAEAVTPVKQARLRRLAAQWLGEQGKAHRGQLRFDVASVLGGRVEVLEGAF